MGVNVRPRTRFGVWLLPAVVAFVVLVVVLRNMALASTQVDDHVAAGSMVSAAPSVATPEYPVTIGAGLTPKLAPAAAAAVAMKQIANNELLLGRSLASPKIVSVEALRGSDLPVALGGPAFDGYPVVWVVKATGTFVQSFGQYGVEPLNDTDGFFLIDDDGSVISSGFPLPT